MTAAPKRVLLYLDDPALRAALDAAFSNMGLEVRTAGSFQELSAWLILYRNAVTVVLQLPPVDALRKATLREMRRLAPAANLVAIVPTASPEIAADMHEVGAVHVLAREHVREAIVEAVRTG